MTESDTFVLKTVAEDVREIKVHITGGDNPEKGLIIRTDRLEQSHKNASKVFWILVGAFLTPSVIGAALYVFLVTF